MLNSETNMKKIFHVLMLSLSLLPSVICGQISDPLQNNFIQGLSFKSGFSFSAVKDEFISNEKYSGSSINYLISWTKYHESYLYDIRMEAITGAEVKNNNASAKVTDFNLSLAYCYPIGSIDLFGKRMNLYLGPYPELYLHFRSQNIASGGTAIIDAYSAAFLLSLGGKVFVSLPLNNNFQLSGELSTSLISLGGKFIDPRDKQNSMIKLLTVLSGMRLSSQYSINYKISDFLSTGAGYRFNIVRISAWDSLLFSSDNFFLSITMDF